MGAESEEGIPGVLLDVDPGRGKARPGKASPVGAEEVICVCVEQGDEWEERCDTTTFEKSVAVDLRGFGGLLVSRHPLHIVQKQRIPK